MPLAKSAVKGELTTPTGAAILVSVVSAFTDTPAMTIERIGTGAGTKDFIEQPNILRIFVGEAHGRSSVGLGERDTVWVLETNLDDCPPEVIGYANGTNFGLCASLWTRDLARAHRVAERLETGTVWVNCWLLRDLRTPFGGVKQSGVGREGGDEALRFFTEPKTVCLKY